MARYLITCDYCNADAELALPGRYCSARHRLYAHRAALKSQRQRLAAQAEDALQSRDVRKLELVAQSAVNLLAPQS